MLIARFLSVGVINTIVGYALIFFFMYALEFSPVRSNLLGYSIGILGAYLLHRNFTFRSSASWRGSLPRFITVVAVAYLLNLAALIVLVDYLGVHAGLSQLVAGVIYVATSFLLSKNFAFSASGTS